MKLTTNNIVIGDASEASKYFSLIKQMKAEMKRLHGKDRPWMQSWTTVGDGVKVHIRLIMGEPKAFIYIARDVYSFGSDSWGQLGLGDLIPNEWIQYLNAPGNFDLPIPVCILKDTYKSVSAGDQFSLMLSSNGDLYFAGNNDCGQGGIGNITGFDPGLFQNAEGTGVHDQFDFGQLGPLTDPDNPYSPHYHDYRFLPVKVPGSFTAVSAGGYHSLALNGTDLYIWGGYRLSNTSIYILSFEPLLIGTDFVEISAGFNHSLMRKTNGDVYAMGINNSGQLGTGHPRTAKLYEPTFVDSGYKSISAGDHHSLGLKENGEVMAWGLDDFEVKFGLPSAPLGGYFLTPVSIGMGDCKFVCAADGYSYVIKTNGDLYVIGAPTFSGSGLLGLAYPTDAVGEFTFVGSDYVFVSASPSHSLGIKSNHDLMSWGNNWNAELGVIGDEFGPYSQDGNQPWAGFGDMTGFGDFKTHRIEFSYIPTLVGVNFVSASAGNGHSLALRYGPPNGEFPVFNSPGQFTIHG